MTAEQSRNWLIFICACVLGVYCEETGGGVLYIYTLVFITRIVDTSSPPVDISCKSLCLACAFCVVDPFLIV